MSSGRRPRRAPVRMTGRTASLGLEAKDSRQVTTLATHTPCGTGTPQILKGQRVYQFHHSRAGRIVYATAL